tara:strand:- start:571 stop:762 length:192 start_codon:yes stop_codon:yes gene_type:complete
MKQVKLKDVKKGEYLKRKPDSENVFIRGDYDRFVGSYELQRFDDVGSFINLKGKTLVWVDFTF